MDDCDTALLPEQVVVTAAQMQQIEEALFQAGMPVAALMEKVAGRVAAWIATHYPRDRVATVGVIVGPGHNGGDALVVARELYARGYQMILWSPFDRFKDLTASHRDYLAYLGLPLTATAEALQAVDVIVDGGFGLGLTRPLTGALAAGVEAINTWGIPVISIDLPSGLETDSGAVLGTAIRARQTLCLGLWKLGLLQDQALPWVGQTHLIPFDIPPAAIQAALASTPVQWRRLTPAVGRSQLPLPRAVTAHKYRAGHLLLLAGSHTYAGAALLAGQGAIASGVGMVTLVVPASLQTMVISQLPEALVIGAPETETGAIADLPAYLEWERYDVVACGPGMTLAAAEAVRQAWTSDRPLVLDADGLNWLAQQTPETQLQQRAAPTVVTPHAGEFQRLFPHLWKAAPSASVAALQAAQTAHCTVVLKGAITAIAAPDSSVWLNSESTAALARGGSGDVLTGLIGGLAAQHCQRQLSPPAALQAAAIAGVWWHAYAARQLEHQRTALGCPASRLAQFLPQALTLSPSTAAPANW